MAGVYPTNSPEAIAVKLVRAWLLSQADVPDLIRRVTEAVRGAVTAERAACAQIAEGRIGQGIDNCTGGYDAACIDIFEAITQRQEQERRP